MVKSEVPGKQNIIDPIDERCTTKSGQSRNRGDGNRRSCTELKFTTG